jgi:YidC/Oxa1 family membrane protein insertase
MLQTIFIEPIYNAFIFILGLVPGGDVGIAIIVLTLIVRIIFYPVFASSIRTQMALQVIQPELDAIKEQYKNDTPELVRRQSELFRKHKIKLPAMFGSVILQLAIFITLSYVFFHIGLSSIHSDLLYSFVHAPAVINERFLGFLDLTKTHNAALALLVAATQYVVMHLSLKRMKTDLNRMTDAQRAAHAMQRNMMLYMFPVAMAIAAYFPAGAVGLYLLVMNLISLGQEWLIRRKPL